MIDVVRYDGLLDLSLSRDCRRKYAPYILTYFGRRFRRWRKVGYNYK
jgi:hypothetical protein